MKRLADVAGKSQGGFEVSYYCCSSLKENGWSLVGGTLREGLGDVSFL